jgi:cytidine deaminase
MKLSDEQRDKLISLAQEVRKNAYAPYSNYAVGAALLTDSGTFYEGANVENAAYPTSICAERSAIFNAVSNGERKIVALAVVTHSGASSCGACRQVLSEFGEDALLLMVNEKGKVILEICLRDFHPHSFGPQDLGMDG